MTIPLRGEAEGPRLVRIGVLHPFPHSHSPAGYESSRKPDNDEDCIFLDLPAVCFSPL